MNIYQRPVDTCRPQDIVCKPYSGPFPGSLQQWKHPRNYNKKTSKNQINRSCMRSCYYPKLGIIPLHGVIVFTAR